MIGPFEIFVFILVLGVLIFVHELGHFVAAKACGIYVDRFSLGMPPRIFGFKIGETDYCIGLLPIGGYVKMAGQEDAPLSEEEREKTYGHISPDRWFNKKAIWQRAVVLAAGPFMNLLLAFVIYAFVAGWGRDVPKPQVDTRVGMVEENSPASKARMFQAPDGTDVDFSRPPDAEGWQTGDKILSVNGEEMKTFEDLMFAAVLRDGETALVEIARPQPDGTHARYVSPIQPKVLDKDLGAAQFGFSPFSAALVEHVMPGSPAEQHGLQKGDIILSANGQFVDRNTFSGMVKDLSAGSALDLVIERGGELMELTLTTRNEGRIDGIGFSPPLNPLVAVPDVAELNVEVTITDPNGLPIIQQGDRIVALNNQDDVGRALRGLARSDFEQNLDVTVHRPASWFGLGGQSEDFTATMTLAELVRGVYGLDMHSEPTIVSIAEEMAEATGLQRKDTLVEVDGEPATAALLAAIERDRVGQSVPVTAERPSLAMGIAQEQKTVRTELPVSSIQQIGVVWGTEMVFRREALGDIIPFAFQECVRQTKRIGSILYSLFAGDISPKLLGGPVMIGDVVTMAARSGFFHVLDITALISINLAIFNLLPLPVLDGGQLTFLAVEAIRRKPVSMRVMETVQQVGLLLIIGLLVYVTFNDFSRIFARYLP